MREPVPWPTWPVDNALASMREMKERMNQHPDPDRADVLQGINHALDYGIAVIEGINNKTNPQPPSIKIVLRNATGELISNIGSAISCFGDRLQEANEWRWRKDPYDY